MKTYVKHVLSSNKWSIKKNPYQTQNSRESELAQQVSYFVLICVSGANKTQKKVVDKTVTMFNFGVSAELETPLTTLISFVTLDKLFVFSKLFVCKIWQLIIPNSQGCCED